ncbi:MAG: homoserine dehydrogenase [Opitutales bacterium]|nr:homoserine dehydrogenase [Opitutales bacterium]
MKKIGIGFIGFGTVGQGVWKNLEPQREELENRLGVKIAFPRIAVRDIGRSRDVDVPAQIMTEDPYEVINDPAVDIVCELMGGTGKAREYTEAALKAGKVVVTANKALIYACGQQLFDLVKKHGGHYYFEASVAGAIPIIKTLREGLVANRFASIAGIINGTCNYILSRMEAERKSYETILADAKALGYVEQDDSLDLDGKDAFHKAVILAFLAHGKWIDEDHALVEGIRNVTLEDMDLAKNFGYRIKLIGLIRRNFKTNALSLSVSPSLVPLDKTLARVDGVYNAIKLSGDVAGTTILIGRGAGRDATSSAVISDIVDAIIGIRDDAHKFFTAADIDANYHMGENLRMATVDEIKSPFYIRVTVADQVGVLADIYRDLAELNISIAKVATYEHRETGTGTVTLLTYPTSESTMEKLFSRFEKIKNILGRPLLLRVYESVRG